MMLPSLRGVMEATGMTYIPDQSTLWKFAGRLAPGLLEDVLQRVASSCCGKDMTVAADAAGFSLTNMSRHMEKMIKEFEAIRKREGIPSRPRSLWILMPR